MLRILLKNLCRTCNRHCYDKRQNGNWHEDDHPNCFTSTYCSNRVRISGNYFSTDTI